MKWLLPLTGSELTISTYDALKGVAAQAREAVRSESLRPREALVAGAGE